MMGTIEQDKVACYVGRYIDTNPRSLASVHVPATGVPLNEVGEEDNKVLVQHSYHAISTTFD
jgi:hypothetical protein